MNIDFTNLTRQELIDIINSQDDIILSLVNELDEINDKLQILQEFMDDDC